MTGMFHQFDRWSKIHIPTVKLKPDGSFSSFFHLGFVTTAAFTKSSLVFHVRVCPSWGKAFLDDTNNGIKLDVPLPGNHVWINKVLARTIPNTRSCSPKPKTLSQWQ